MPSSLRERSRTVGSRLVARRADKGKTVTTSKIMAQVLTCDTPKSYSVFSRGSTPERSSREPVWVSQSFNELCCGMAGGFGLREKSTRAQRSTSACQQKKKAN